MMNLAPRRPSVRTLAAHHYITPLREGGSLPAVVEADDGRLYVAKFQGAGQGQKALVAELVAGELARALGLAVPEIVLLGLDPMLGRSEADPEIRQLIQDSVGLNLALRFLPKAFAFNPILKPAPDAGLASLIVWFDAFVTNVDRTARNTNLLLWQDKLWLIDHGSSLYFHHSAGDRAAFLDRSHGPFPLIKDHVLLPFASRLAEADVRARAALARPIVEQIVELVPDVWLKDDPGFASAEAQREAYAAYLNDRLEGSAIFLKEAQRARQQLL
jgi:hypothetical protein